MVSLPFNSFKIFNCFSRAGGIIVKAFATDFESLSQDGKLHVIVQNTGLVTADYFVSCLYVSCVIGGKIRYP